MSEDLNLKFEKLSATVRSQAKAQHRFMELMMFDKLTGGGGVGGEVGQQTHLLDGLATIVAAPSVELIRDIVDDGAALDSEVSLLKDVYQVAKDRGSDSLRKAAARMLGSLMLKSDFNPEDIEFLKDDLQSVFSSTAYPRLLNEDDYFDKMDAAYMFLGQGENGLPPDDKKKLLSLLDLPLLSYSATRRVERFLKNKWGRPVLSELRTRKFVRPTREYKSESLAVVVTEADLRDDVARLAITDRFEREPDTMCILDVSGFLDESGKLLAGKLKNLPPNVRHLSVSNGSGCTAIGDDFLNQHPSLTTADLTGLNNVTEIGNSFLEGCSKLKAVNLANLNNITAIGSCFFQGCTSLAAVDLSILRNVSKIADNFLEGCSSLTDLDLVSLNKVTVIGHSFLEGCSSLRGVVNLASLENVTKIGQNFFEGCSSLVTLDLVSLNKVSKVGGWFLLGCSSLSIVGEQTLNPLLRQAIEKGRM